MTAPFLIIETGQPVASMRRHGTFPHWIRVASGLPRDRAVTINAQAGDTLPTTEGFAGVIVTGSDAMVTERHDWSEATAAWLADAARAGFPVFGICYGHQLLAHALGGEVGNNPAGREMGTQEIELLPAAAADALFAPLPERFPVQLTHEQSVLRAPDGATVLARSALDACQSFRWGDNAWGVQFHPELSATHMRGYIQARKVALQREGLDPAAMVAQVAATPEGRRVMRRFVHHATGLARTNG
ncbi:glutamine amidotransferase [Lysobacter avium]|uniref:Glutamine amidotransferase n=2 Tax=Novilysobacter avium TaxID=2781023 RepID=A0A7S6UKE3_9GAMM|nr:glutamine amidotransferase [Lysobacter avium]